MVLLVNLCVEEIVFVEVVGSGGLLFGLVW